MQQRFTQRKFVSILKLWGSSAWHSNEVHVTWSSEVYRTRLWARKPAWNWGWTMIHTLWRPDGPQCTFAWFSHSLSELYRETSVVKLHIQVYIVSIRLWWIYSYSFYDFGNLAHKTVEKDISTEVLTRCSELRCNVCEQAREECLDAHEILLNKLEPAATIKESKSITVMTIG